MTKQHRLLLPAIFSVSLLFAQPADRADSLYLEEVMSRQAQCWNAGDLECFMKGYWESDSLRYIGSNGIRHGWRATLERYRAAYPDRESMGHLTFETISAEYLCEDKILLIGRWSLQRTGDKPGGYYTLIWQRRGGGWVIVLDHSS